MEIINEQFRFFTHHTIDNPLDDNIDVSITLPNGKKYAATFFTVKNIESLMKKWEKTGEYNGKYFWVPDMFIIKKLEIDIITQSILEILEMGDFETTFKEIEVIE